jgi:hypothetical protein
MASVFAPPARIPASALNGDAELAVQFAFVRLVFAALEF